MKFTKKDFAVVLILILISLVLFLFLNHDTGNYLRVTRDNEVVEVLPLNQDLEKTYLEDGEENTLVIQDGTAKVIEANCENQICVNSPEIKNVGETICCLPHGLILEVISN